MTNKCELLNDLSIVLSGDASSNPAKQSPLGEQAYGTSNLKI